MKQTNAPLSYVSKAEAIKPDSEIAPRESYGILVQEGELGSAIAQRFYRMRCGCGRSWIELELKKLVKCPACSRLNFVRLQWNDIASPAGGAGHRMLPVLEPAPGSAKKSIR